MFYPIAASKSSKASASSALQGGLTGRPKSSAKSASEQEELDEEEEASISAHSWSRSDSARRKLIISPLFSFFIREAGEPGVDAISAAESIMSDDPPKSGSPLEEGDAGGAKDDDDISEALILVLLFL